MGFVLQRRHMPAKLPKPVTQTHVDWTHYRPYLEKKYPKEWKKHYDPLWFWFCGTSDFHNGCFVNMEKGHILGYTDNAAVNWFADRIFEDYGKIADRWGVIKLWVWW